MITETAPGRNFAERILGELQVLRKDMNTVMREVGILNEIATMLLRPNHEEEESPLAATMRLLGLLVGGTEETHRRLETLHATLVDPRMTAALRSAMVEN